MGQYRRLLTALPDRLQILQTEKGAHPPKEWVGVCD